MTGKKKENRMGAAKKLTEAEIAKLEAQKKEIQNRLRQSADDRDWSKVWRKCTRCGHEGFVIPDFRTRLVRGKLYANAWCTPCRNMSGATSRKKPVSKRRAYVYSND